DEDLGDVGEVTSLSSERDRRTEGRFALYSADPPEPTAPTTKSGQAKSGEATSGERNSGERNSEVAELPDIVIELDYDELTLAQLRARLQSLNVEELDALLSYEEATKARAPFVTLLANRITRASAK